MQVSWKFEGGQELARALDKLPDALKRPTVIGALKKAGEPIRAAAEARAPKGDGPEHLADHIAISAIPDSSTSRGGRDPETDFAIKIGPTSQFFYGLFAELGTAHQPARPWLRPPFDALAGPSLGVIGRELWKAIKGAAESPRAPGTGSRGGVL